MHIWHVMQERKSSLAVAPSLFAFSGSLRVGEADSSMTQVCRMPMGRREVNKSTWKAENDGGYPLAASCTHDTAYTVTYT